MNRATIRYNDIQEQWCVELKGREYGLHCGESFELIIGRKSIRCRLEMATKWYVIMGDTRLDLREGDKYMINY